MREKKKGLSLLQLLLAGALPALPKHDFSQKAPRAGLHEVIKSATQSKLVSYIFDFRCALPLLIPQALSLSLSAVFSSTRSVKVLLSSCSGYKIFMQTWQRLIRVRY